MGAYNREGQLTRVVKASREQERERNSGGGSNESTQQRQPSDPNNPDGADNPDGTKAATLPPESRRDLTPFPLDPQFISQPVLSGWFKDQIWKQVILQGLSVREVSASLGVEMSRVAAVVRLVEIEKEWKRINKPLMRQYHQAVMNMLPKTLWNPEETTEENRKKTKTHESINDLPVHVATGQQIFLPTSESRHFTRKDAARVFDAKLLPADDRVPHPELAVMHKEVLEELSDEERKARAEARDASEEQKRKVALARQAKKEASIKKVDIGRFEYRFSEIKVDDAGKDGRGLKGVGWRYGVPLMDRSRGQHKIPRAVE
ncbi:uncharacterized protein LY89DRAFT_598310 [Mollisia scopiformis]|uniref:Eukaryotic mitochondrial regulator protein-domain-containing protein n=1 Tax=Mollisia scopiformis TaxID=149040 RepID=A0A132BA12_MOLSC|nr:uncharacterized protein LY89DRAFT_598310 [Mollisia scopiformis]KUJ09242.1 hypothetical protein LY89DRAFT_598310 [Mollisia scopiformis]